MTDKDLILKRLAFIESCVADLKRDAQPSALETSVRERRFIEHTLQLAIQSALDVASHVVSDEKLGEPRTNRELFTLLARHGWLEADLSRQLELMAGFRNVLVHGYTEVDLGIVRDILDNHLQDLLDFVSVIRPRVP
jgi:uncharacterized protein YutE (UPF0331/DUF86 family)